MAEEIQRLIAGHRFFTHIKPEFVQSMIACASIKHYKEGEILGREGTHSDCFFALVEGRVAIESYQPGLDPVVLQTLRGGEVVGWSWLFPPYEWVFDAKALTDVRTIAFDAPCLRAKCEKDPSLGFELMKRFAQVMTLRLKATRLQLLDIYGCKAGQNAKGRRDE